MISLAVGSALAASLAVIYDSGSGRFGSFWKTGRRDARAAADSTRRSARSDAASSRPPPFPLREDLKAALQASFGSPNVADLAESCTSLPIGSGPATASSCPTRPRVSRSYASAEPSGTAETNFSSPAYLSADETERTIRTDLIELAAIGADLRVRHAPADAGDDARRDALRMLDEAESVCGPSFALDVRRDDFADATGNGADPKRTLVPTSAWEHYDLGRYNLRNGQVEQAARAFERSLELKPQDFWANFYHGLCSFRLGRFEAAVADFRACLAIEPGSAVAHYNRALAHDCAGRQPGRLSRLHQGDRVLPRASRRHG